MLELKSIKKSFNGKIALNDLSFKVDKGRILGLVGRNGAGKSTTFRLILNIITPDSGEILYNGEKTDANLVEKIGYLPEEGSLIQTYTVLELCEYYGALKLMDAVDVRNTLEKWLKAFNILEYMNFKIKNLSKGNRQKIQFIIANLHNPEFLILDEPFSGLDPVSVEEIKKFIILLKNQGKTIIFSSHRMDHIEEICDDIIILNKGEILLQGSLKKIISNYKSKGKKNISLNEIFIKSVGDGLEAEREII